MLRELVEYYSIRSWCFLYSKIFKFYKRLSSFNKRGLHLAYISKHALWSFLGQNGLIQGLVFSSQLGDFGILSSLIA